MATIGPVTPKPRGIVPEREPAKKEPSSIGYVWKSFIEFPANLYLLMLKISNAMANAFSSRQNLEDAAPISKAVDLNEPYKKMNLY